MISNPHDVLSPLGRLTRNINSARARHPRLVSADSNVFFTAV